MRDQEQRLRPQAGAQDHDGEGHDNGLLGPATRATGPLGPPEIELIDLEHVDE